LAIKRDCLVDAARVQFGPPEAIWPRRLEATHRFGLPGREVRPRRVLEHGHSTLIADVERGRDDLATSSFDLLRQCLRVTRAEVHVPGARRLGCLLRSDARDILPADLSHSIAAVLRIRGNLDVPAEEVRIEV